MSSVLLALLIAASAGTWIYSKFMRTTGGNNGTAITAAGVSGVLIFVLVLILANMFM